MDVHDAINRALDEQKRIVSEMIQSSAPSQEWIPLTRSKPKPWQRVFVKLRNDLLEPYYIGYLDPDDDEFVIPNPYHTARVALDSVEAWAPIEG